MSINADPNASFSLSTWILKLLITIKTLSAASTNSDRKSANSLIGYMVPWWPVYSSQHKHHRGFIINTCFSG